MTQFFIYIWDVMRELAPWLLLGAFIAALLHVLVPADFIRKHLGGKSWWNVIKASFIGVPMPLCSCSVIPTGIGLKKDGASDGASISFLISTPQTGVDSISVAAGFLGWPFAIFKVLSAFIMGIVGGQIINLLDNGDDNKAESGGDSAPVKSCCSTEPAPQVVKSCCDDKPEQIEQKSADTASCCDDKKEDSPAPATSCCGDEATQATAAPSCCGSESAEAPEHRQQAAWKRGLDFAVNDLLRMIWLWLVLGVLISAALSSFINPGALADYTWATGISAMVLMLLISLPLYVCATASVPIAASLIAAGLPTGAALVFLMAGPATNVATIGAIVKAFGKLTTLIYLVTVIAGSIGFGLLFEVFFELESVVDVGHQHEHAAWWADACAIVLSLLFIYFAVKDIQARIKAGTSKDAAAAASCH